ncbi:hypothetical protein T440DRAFT_266215 [Plenodomus tracheiphilus IPT5]|uniref:Uncharacterized protein n=1 Tax=Plenodomus tracheiphilus IPT5 TaxID=1408161 RepID=A0A6A7BFJ9_9PLEO|nr:hypothetical protein T440DRAFT_266215 [Plenodomus tracheiphilus IPT5]
MAPEEPAGLVGRARKASVSMMNMAPQLGMWQATGTAIAQAPNLTELREPESGGANITFDAHGHSSRIAKPDDAGGLVLVKTDTKIETTSSLGDSKSPGTPPRHPHRAHMHSLHEKHKSDVKEKWGPAIMNGLKAFWKFFTTPTGFLITIYGLNVVAWGAMLFFLLLKAAPAMNHPSADDDNSPRKIWLEIDSQILNALFCVTGFGLAPWRFRDFYWLIRVIHFHDHAAMRRLTVQNKAWFRPSAEYADALPETTTFTGERAPPTPVWKLAFTVDMMVLNTLLQAVLCYFMWGYNRIDRPSWATGTFIALGCGVAMFAGIMSWWEGRKVKKIEGPEVKIVQV